MINDVDVVIDPKTILLKKEVEDLIRYHYWDCKCVKDAKYEDHCKAILHDIMVLIDYKPRDSNDKTVKA